MPHKGGRKRNTPRKAYAQKAAQLNNPAKANGDWVPQSSSGNGSTFSMLDAARSTEHRGAWGDKKLRETRVDFVAASQYSTLSDSIITTESSHQSPQNLLPGQTKHITAPVDESSRQISAAPSSLTTSVLQPPVPETQAATARNIFFVDTVGDPSLRPRTVQEKSSEEKKREDDNDSDSSEEVIVFAGRKASTVGRRDSPRNAQDVRVVEENMEAVSLGDRDIDKPKDHHVRPALSPSVRSTVTAARSDPEAEAMADYVANIRAQHTDTGGDSDELEATRTISISKSRRILVPSDVGLDNGSTPEEFNIHEQEFDESSSEDLSEGELVDSSDEPPDESQLGQAAAFMSDEQLARRLAKQEELGLDADEVLLWAEEDMADVVAEEKEEAEASLDILRNAAQKLSAQKKQRSRRRDDSLLPELFGGMGSIGDSYGDFDIMDFDRPSLKRRSKGSRELPFEVSDSELEANMIMAWQNDRTKKKHRKEQREQQRIEGLLGGSRNSASRVKHSADTNLTDIRDELSAFLSCDATMLSMAPMDKRMRKAVHEIANKFNIRSSSKGSGHNRYPCLYKTSSTRHFDAILVDALLRRYSAGKDPSQKGNFNRMRSAKLNSITKRNHGGNGGVTAGVSYRHGETVGASAPALGVENKGHSMLSKMGWTSGTAIGADNNKGSLEPVPHVVRATRAGLG